MSGLFVGESGSRCSVGTNANTLPDINTILVWCYPTTIDANYQAVYEKTSSDFSDYRGIGINGTTGELGCFMRRGSPGFTGIDVSKSNVMVANTWQFIGCQMDATSASNTAQKLFYGTLTSQVAEVSSYDTQSAGSGATSPQAVNAYIGNSGDTASGFPGRIACILVFSRLLTLGEIIDQQFNPHKTANCELFMHIFGTGTQADLSGNGRNGTLTSVTSDIHVPIGRLF